jgi:hypothetical protein
MGRIYPAGIHQAKRLSVPCAFGVDAVTRSSRHIVNDRQPVTDQAVEQSALSNIGPPDKGYDGF